MCRVAHKQMDIKKSKKINPTVRILEIGVNNGHTTMPLATNLMIMQIPFKMEAVDIQIKSGVVEQVYYTVGLNKRINLIQENSIAFLQKKLAEKPIVPYDIVLIDGDHNYETVSKECELLTNFIYEDTLIIFDDYSGKYAYKDIYYANNDEYKENTIATPAPINDAQQEALQGVKPAVDAFFEKNLNLKPFSFFPSNPPICAIDGNSKVYSQVIAPHLKNIER